MMFSSKMKKKVQTRFCTHLVLSIMSEPVDNDVPLQHRKRCDICKTNERADGKNHRCVECGIFYATAEDVEAHCARAGHTGGHSKVLEQIEDRVRLKPIRHRRSAAEDDLLHQELGLYDEIDQAADGESSDDDDAGEQTTFWKLFSRQRYG